MSRMTIRVYRITDDGQRVDVTAPEEVEQKYRLASPLAWARCTCPRCANLPDCCAEAPSGR
ncbi:RNase P subunit RPR2 [Kitasatospora sp. MAP12-15]|uniref:hypothetical protein n=1 Tax=unclassified Kitasatospora TaxID=2633591 RepID=UPI00247433A3|nr:hypothetical protein [Kitasatospora sp. MAP12-44]MDH6112156.1 RNase P subunit RPR2 [Kitasatospora sp. MAP12-44]